jgi:hypothetical protein
MDSAVRNVLVPRGGIGTALIDLSIAIAHDFEHAILPEIGALLVNFGGM